MDNNMTDLRAFIDSKNGVFTDADIAEIGRRTRAARTRADADADILEKIGRDVVANGPRLVHEMIKRLYPNYTDADFAVAYEAYAEALQDVRAGNR
jgi:hypothetical protein